MNHALFNKVSLLFLPQSHEGKGSPGCFKARRDPTLVQSDECKVIEKNALNTMNYALFNQVSLLFLPQRNEGNGSPGCFKAQRDPTLVQSDKCKVINKMH
jgi:hypothetical protein